MRTNPVISHRIQTRIAIQNLRDKGLTKAEITRQGYNQCTVKKWFERSSYKNEGGQGRRSKFTNDIKHRIEVLMKGKAGVGTRTAAKNLSIQKEQERLDWVPKRSTIQRYLKTTEWGRQAYRLRTKPLLSEKNIQDRVQFCQTVDNNGYLDPKRRGVEKRAHILWTDESPIPLHPKPNAQNMQIRVAGRDEIPIIQLPKCSETVMIAGGICSRGNTFDYHP